MSVDRPFLSLLDQYLDDRADESSPAYLDRVLERTASTRQRAWWSSPERWLPVDLTMRRPLVPSIRPRAIALLVLLALLVASIAAYAIGTRHRVPPPFGLAQNGEVVVGSDGDLSVADPATGERRPLISGPTFDFGPVFSRDGTRFLFLRGGPTDCGQPDCGLLLMVADADGTAPRAVTPGTPLLDWVDWSPDGLQIAFLGPVPKGNGHSINVVNVDGTGLHRLDVGRPAHLVSFRSGADPEIVFRGDQPTVLDPAPGIFAVHPDGTGLRDLSPRPARDQNDFQDLTVSWDGNLVAYQSTDDGLFQIHILDLRTGVDRALPAPPTMAQTRPVFSPDARFIAYTRFETGQRVQLVVAPVDGAGTGRGLGPVVKAGDEAINGYQFTPDGSAVFASYEADKTARLVPIDGSAPVVLVSGELALVAYQRLAP